MRSRLLRTLCASLTMLAALPAAQAALIYSLADDGRTLVRFDSTSPGAVTTVGALSGATTRLDGMDFRPADGLLYGYSDTSDAIYRVDPGTGATTLVSTSSTPTTTPALGIDFNPVPDRLRIVNQNGQNLRVNVATGAALVDGTLAFAAGDANAGAAPSIVDAAYTNSDRNPATGTTLYYIDALLDILVSTANPNAGVLDTIGALGVDTDRYTGFDILTGVSGANIAFASLTSGGSPALYTINLATGAATLVGAIGARELYGLAVVPGFLSAPGSAALVLAAGLAVVALRRRRSA